MAHDLTTPSPNNPVHLGNWRLPSGNQCSAALVKNLPDKVGVKFKWSSPATLKDQEDLVADVLRHVMEQVRAQLPERADVVREVHKLGEIYTVSTDSVRGTDVEQRVADALWLASTDDLIDQLGRRAEAFLGAYSCLSGLGLTSELIEELACHCDAFMAACDQLSQLSRLRANVRADSPAGPSRAAQGEQET